MSEIIGYITPVKRATAEAGSCFSERHITALRFLCLVSIVLALLAISPVQAEAGSKYIAGSPELNAHITGTNEFSPGEDIDLPIAIENTGLNEFKIVKSG
ncbi:MAG: S-layer protein, partial [Methanoregula sp.]